ncbi:MAG: thioredoxin domain-containing protein [Nonomuraea sp.]|nr:thioredoxin domain-containing protein [Nonomuraea sp.]
MSKAARERIRAERARRARGDRRRRIAIITGVSALVVAVVVAGVLVQSWRGRSSAYSGPLAQVTVAADGTVTMARAGNLPVLDVYEDFQCPVCREFESVNGGTLKRFAAEGKVKVVYHPVAFVNPQGSLRAAAAAQCLPAPRWMAFHDTVYSRQPPESVALTLADLKGFAAEAEVTDAATLSCMESQRHASLVTRVTDAAFKQPDVQGTPTLVLGGRRLTTNEMLTADGLAGVLAAAR